MVSHDGFQDPVRTRLGPTVPAPSSLPASSSSTAAFNFVEQWCRRGWHGGLLDDQSCAVQSVDHAVERQQAIIEGMELVNIRDARGRKMNGIRKV